MPAIPQKQFTKAYTQLLEKIAYEPNRAHKVFFGNRFRWVLNCSQRESDHTDGTYLAITLFHYHTKILEVYVFDETPFSVIKYINCTSVSDRDGINSLLHLLSINRRVSKGTTYTSPDSIRTIEIQPMTPTIRL